MDINFIQQTKNTNSYKLKANTFTIIFKTTFTDIVFYAAKEEESFLLLGYAENYDVDANINSTQYFVFYESDTKVSSYLILAAS